MKPLVQRLIEVALVHADFVEMQMVEERVSKLRAGMPADLWLREEVEPQARRPWLSDRQKALWKAIAAELREELRAEKEAA